MAIALRFDGAFEILDFLAQVFELQIPKAVQNSNTSINLFRFQFFLFSVSLSVSFYSFSLLSLSASPISLIFQPALFSK